MEAPEVFEIDVAAPGVVAERMDELSGARRGWITLQPGVDPLDVPRPQSVLGRVFAGSGPPVPVCTWVAPLDKQRPPHGEVGILHATGPKVEGRLDEAGLPVPPGWVVLSDHPRRGLVVAVHPESASLAVVRWLLDAGTALSRIRVTGSWRVEVHRG